MDLVLRPVYGYAKQGAPYGFTKIASKQVLCKGLSPRAATISTDLAAPVIAGMRLRAGKAASAREAGRMVAQAITATRAAGVSGEILVRGDSVFGGRAVIGAYRRLGARFSLVLTKNRAVDRAIASIPDEAWTPVKYPGAVRDPDTGAWTSDAEAEIPYTAFASKPDRITARLIARRVEDAARQDELFPVWPYHPFFTDSAEPTVDADLTHRRSGRRRRGAAASQPQSGTSQPQSGTLRISRSLALHWPGVNQPGDHLADLENGDARPGRRPAGAGWRPGSPSRRCARSLARSRWRPETSRSMDPRHSELTARPSPGR